MKIKLLVFGLLFSIVSWGQTPIMTWDFETNNNAVANLPGGTATISSNGITVATSACTGTKGYGGSNWVSGDYIQILAPTIGYNITTMELNVRSSGTGPAKLDVQYSSTGTVGAFTTIGQINAGNATCAFNSVDFSSINALDNNANVVIRLVGGNYGEADGNPSTGNPAGTGTLRIDDVVINGMPTCTAPANPIGTITITQNCGATNLTFSAPNANWYWQTSATGTSIANPTTIPYSVTTGGTYYVRAFNGVDCWSTGTVSQAVTIVNPVLVTTPPSDQSVIAGNTASFSVAASNVVTYQWQLSTDGGTIWNAISGATSSSYTTPITTSGMTGYKYRVVLTNVCGSVTSTVATLTITVVTNFKPGELIFVGFDSTSNCLGAEDKYYLTSLVDIIPGTEFLIVNSRYEAGAAANVRTERWYGGSNDPYENPGIITFKWNGASNIPAGSIISFRAEGTSIIDLRINNSTTTNFTVTTNTNQCNISATQPDQIYIVQGTFTPFGAVNVDRYNLLTGKVLFGLTNRTDWVPFSSSVSNGNADVDRVSRLPDDIECFNIALTSTEGVKFYRNDAPHSGSKNGILGAIMNTSNWEVPTNDQCLNVPEDFNSPYTAGDVGMPFTITVGNPDGYWTGNDDTNWFNCKNWEGLYVPVPTTDVIITNKANDPTIGASPVKFEMGAEANNLSISAAGMLTMNNALSYLNLYGNWTNNVGNAAFSEGNGTVHFTGSTPQIINNVTPEGTETFYNVILNNDFDTSVSNDIIAKGSVTVNNGKTLNIASNDFVEAEYNVTNNGAINIQDDGSLVQLNDAGIYSGTGTNSMIRVAGNVVPLKSRDYVYWSSPIAAAPFSTIPHSRLYEWDTDVVNPTGYGQGNWIPTVDTSMQLGKGYIFRVANSNPTQTVTFSGSLFNNALVGKNIIKGTIIADEPGVNVTTITKYDDNWNLVGNPYPSAIDVATFSANNSAVLEDGAVYLWRHLTAIAPIASPYYQTFVYNYTSSDYVGYNGTASIPAGAFDGKIAAGQAFFVNMKESLGSNSANLEFRNGQRGRSNNNSQFFKNANNSVGAPIEKNRIWLDLVDANMMATTQVVAYVEGATNGNDFYFDAKSDYRQGFGFYSLNNNSIFKIQARSLPFDSNDLVPIGVQLPADGTYSIAINQVDGLFTDKSNKIYIEDKLLNSINDITTMPYQFTATKGIVNDRFVLRFTNTTLGNGDFEWTANEVKVFGVSHSIYIKSEIEPILSYRVYNVLGQLLASKSQVNAREVELQSILKNNQALIVKVTLENGQTVTKKIIF